jgi:prepilin-type N-terminal cleavage/methylation domain-containing protein
MRSCSKLDTPAPWLSAMLRRPGRADARPGFTLIELMVVMAVLVILMGLLMATLGRVSEQRKKTLAQKQVSDIAQAALAYSQTLAAFPPDTGVLVLEGDALAQPVPFDPEEVETTEPYQGSGPEGFVADSICRYLGRKVRDAATKKMQGPFLDIRDLHIREVDDKKLFVDPWGHPYLMDCVHVRRVESKLPPGADDKLVDKPYEARRVGEPYDTAQVPVAERVKEVKVWSLGPDGKAGDVPMSRIFGAPTEPTDQDNIRSW